MNLAICLGVPYWKYETIQGWADSFLQRYHPRKTIPIPIEIIVERDLQLGIVPIPNLLKDHRVDGFLKSHCREIVVDQFICNYRPSRYHFTLAHEVGHLQMHADLYRKVRVDSLHDWKDFQNNLSEKSRTALEWQANAFAGLILVPADDLESAIRSCVRKFAGQWRRAEAAEVSKQALEDRLTQAVSEEICKLFGVSAEVIVRRIEREGFLVSAM